MAQAAECLAVPKAKNNHPNFYKITMHPIKKPSPIRIREENVTPDNVQVITNSFKIGLFAIIVNTP